MGNPVPNAYMLFLALTNAHLVPLTPKLQILSLDLLQNGVAD